MYRVFLKKSAQRDLDRINEPFFSKILLAIESLEKNPRNTQTKKLVNRDNEYRMRVGDYRVLFFIDEAEMEIRIARVIPRQDAYKD